VKKRDIERERNERVHRNLIKTDVTERKIRESSYLAIDNARSPRIGAKLRCDRREFIFIRVKSSERFRGRD